MSGRKVSNGHFGHRSSQEVMVEKGKHEEQSIKKTEINEPKGAKYATVSVSVRSVKLVSGCSYLSIQQTSNSRKESKGRRSTRDMKQERGKKENRPRVTSESRILHPGFLDARTRNEKCGSRKRRARDHELRATRPSTNLLVLQLRCPFFLHYSPCSIPYNEGDYE